MNDIWSSGILTFDSPLKDLLDTQNYTLEDLLNEDELLQEVKGCHPQLKAFFNEESNVAGLIQCLLRNPPSLSLLESDGTVGGDGDGDGDGDDTVNESVDESNDNGTDTDTDNDTDDDEHENQNKTLKFEDNEIENLEQGQELTSVVEQESKSNDDAITSSTADTYDHNNVAVVGLTETKTTYATVVSKSLLSNDESSSTNDNITTATTSTSTTPLANTNNEKAKVVIDNNSASTANAEADEKSATSSNTATTTTATDTDTATTNTNPATPKSSTTNDDDDSESKSNLQPNMESETEQTQQSQISNSIDADANANSTCTSPASTDLVQQQSETKPAVGEWLLDNITEKIDDNDDNDSNHNNKSNMSIDTSMDISHDNDISNNNNNNTTNNTMTKEEYEQIFVRYPYMACEVICCESEDILDIIVYGTVEINNSNDCVSNDSVISSEINFERDNNVESDNKSNDGDNDRDGDNQNNRNKNKTKTIQRRQSILDMLFSILFTTPPSQLDDRRAGYLEKILSVLFRTRPKAMESYLNGDPDSTSACESLDEDEQYGIHRSGGIALLDALFKHLHSNSISQIVQRLLMPKPPSNKSSNGNNNENEDGNNNEWGSSSNGNNNDGNDEEEYDDDNLITSGIEEYGKIDCNWSDGEYALNLMLERLFGEKSDLDCFLDDLEGDNSTITAERDTDLQGLSLKESKKIDSDSGSDDTITLFDCSQHASEILIAIIQNSTLSSNVMKILTRSDVLSKLIECSCFPSPNLNKNSGDNGDIISVAQYFSRHESTMTTAMSVLETLVLQLGGYGTVPTSPMYVDNNQGTVQNVDVNNTNAAHDEVIQSDANSQVDDGSSPKTQQTFGAASNRNQSFPVEANTSSLLQQLPILLVRLSKLLQHPDTLNWKSYVQYSKEPQQLLGASRLRIVRLIESLVLLGRKNVDHILCQSDCLEICLDLFWDFPWCSMLHQSVANLLVHVLEGGEERTELQRYFLYNCNLMQRLMQSFRGVQDITDVEDESKGDNDVTSTNVTSNEENKLKDDSNYGSLLEMKNVQIDSSSGSSSLDAERGSISSIEDDHDIPESTDETDSIPVSDDDVDAVMEQEELEKLNLEVNEGCDNKLVDSSCSKLKEELADCNGKNDDEISSNPINLANADEVNNSKQEFRIGYMGHVIIICQALVHACGTNDKINNEIAPKSVNQEEYTTSEIKQDLSNNSDQTGISEVNSLTNGDNNFSEVLTPSNLIGRQEAESSGNVVEISSPDKTSTEHNSIMSLLRGHKIYSEWLGFVTTTLASETAVQSTPLGGCNNQNDSNIGEQVVEPSWSNDELVDHDIGDNSRGTYAGDGGIDLDNTKFDDAEVDIAASLMENISLPTPPTNGTEEVGQGNGGRHRRKGVLGGEGAGNGTGAEFGTVVQMHQNSGEYYQYDDPLGQWQHQFPDNMGFDGKDFGENENDDNDIENDVPVMDLFTGNLNFDDANGHNDDTGWANFDEGFAACTDNGDTPQIIDSSPDPFDSSNSPVLSDDFFGQDNSSQFVASFGDEEPTTQNNQISNSNSVGKTDAGNQ